MKNPNGFGSVYKLSGKRRKPYIVRVTEKFTPDGKQVFKTVGYYKTRKEANIALAEYNKNPFNIDARKLTFAEVYEKWSERKFPELSLSRAKTYKYIYGHLSDFHELKFADIKLHSIQSYIDSRSDLSSSTLSNYKFLFNQLYLYAIKHEIVEKNYAALVEIKKTEKTNDREIFSIEEIWQLWDNQHDKTAQLILILIYTGFRIRELLTVKRENVFLDERYIIGGFKTPAGENRIVPINKKILPFIESLYQDNFELLVSRVNKEGECVPLSYDYFRNMMWKPLLAKLGMKHKIHDTRHTAISLMDAAGVNRVAMKRIVGHSDRDITDSYTHKTTEELIAEIDKL